MYGKHAVDEGLDKLQDFLLAMQPGDEVSTARAQEVSGLTLSTCHAVLCALMRAGLMVQLQPTAFVRVRLEHPALQPGKSPFNPA
jgi:hypothetical protein